MPAGQTLISPGCVRVWDTGDCGSGGGQLSCPGLFHAEYALLCWLPPEHGGEGGVVADATLGQHCGVLGVTSGEVFMQFVIV